MATTTQLQKFTDFDRLFTWKNFIITLLGSVAAFSFSYYTETMLDVSEYGPPFTLSFTFAAIIIVAVYTRNIASAGIVGIVGGLGVVSPYGGSVDWVLSYIAICLIFALIMGMFANKLLLVNGWIKLHLAFAILFSGFLLGLSIITHTETDEYTSRGADLGVGGDLGTGYDLPMFDIVVFAVLFLLVVIIFVLTRKPMILDSENIFKYEVFGALFLLLGQAFSFIMLLGLTEDVRESTMNEIARKPYHLQTVGDLFSHESSGDFYAIVTEPFSIYVILSLASVFTAVGLSFLFIAKYRGNVEGVRGGSDIAYLAAPIGLMLFIIGGLYYLQNFMYEDGFFISIELVAMFTTMIWAVIYFNQIIARVILLVLDKIMKPN
ncbi:MAG: hypothetical protein ACW99A_09910 [Candidatus Kariarchaeaceae archaeon]